MSDGGEDQWSTNNCGANNYIQALCEVDSFDASGSVTWLANPIGFDSIYEIQQPVPISVLPANSNVGIYGMTVQSDRENCPGRDDLEGCATSAFRRRN